MKYLLRALMVVLAWRSLGDLNGPALAQFTTASLAGTVSDPSGASVPGAGVTIQNEQTGLTRRTNTGADGVYRFPALPIGSWKLRVEKAGFSTSVQEGIQLDTNEAATVDVTVQVGAVSNEVEVMANTTMVNTQTATLSQLVDQQRIVELPLNGRTPQSLVFITPGAVNVGITGSQGGVYPTEQGAAVNGGGRMNVNYEMDGAAHNDTYVSENLPFPNPDAISEFNVQTTNMSAEYGNSTSVVNIVTKSGTNQLHGDAFEFLRNGDLNARNFFAATHDTLARNQFGGTLGGPIRKDRLFFFGTYQGTLTRSASASVTSFVPTQAERNGDFSSTTKQLKDPVTNAPFPGNQVPVSQFTAPSKYFLQGIPLPNGPGELVTFIGRKSIQRDDQLMPKVDWNRGRNQVSGRYFYSRYSQPPDYAAAAKNYLNLGGANLLHVQTLALNDTFTASPTLLFNTWFGWHSQTGGSLSGDPPDNPITFPAAGVKIAGGAPGISPALEQLSVGGYFTIASSHQGDFNRGDFQFREAVSMERGPHEVIFGGELVRLLQDITNTNTQSGTFNFTGQLSGSNLVDFLLGDATTFQQGAGQYQNARGIILGLFIQDNWRVNQKLRLNLGLRWDPSWPYKEIQNRMLCFGPGQQSQRYPNAPTGLIYGSDPGCPAGTGRDTNLGNFAPRLGFAYEAARDTVIRGGAGIYYAITPTDQLNGIGGASAPFSPRFQLNNVNFQDPYGSAGISNPFPAQFTRGIPPPPGPNVQFTLPILITNNFERNFHASAMATWNLTVERAVARNWLFSAGYVGNSGYHLSLAGNSGPGMELNPAIYIPGQSTTANTQNRRRVQGISSVTVTASDYNSRYDALQLNVERRFGRGFSLLANYTWSKQLDSFGPGGSTTNPFNRNFDWGLSDLDRTHLFNFSAVWQIPGRIRGPAGAVVNGWEVTALTNWESGAPFSILSGVDNSLSGVGRDRADFTGTDLAQAKLNGLSHAQEIQRFFNTSLFVPNALGRFGDSGKNILRGPRSFNTDAGVIKNIRITEHLRSQLRGEFFNAFNNVNLGQPGATIGSPNLGKITSAGGPRILQLALKVSF
jgi:hypothetical protein